MLCSDNPSDLDSLTVVKKFFSKYERQWETERKVGWRHLFTSLEQLYKDAKSDDMKETICNNLFCLLEDTKCDERFPIQEGIAFYISSRPWLFIYSLHKSFLEYYLHPYCLFDLPAVSLLLRYGVPFQLPRVQEMNPSYLEDVIYGLNIYFASVVNIQTPVIFTRHVFDSVISNYPTIETWTRLGLVMCGVEVVIQTIISKSYYANAIKSYKLVFKATPQPLITVKEISRFLNILYDGQPDKGEKIENIIKEFSERFPKGCEPLKPRKLHHLARCQVRKCLIDAEKLPHGVWTLNIPLFLKNYVLMQKTEDEFRPKNKCPLPDLNVS